MRLDAHFRAEPAAAVETPPAKPLAVAGDIRLTAHDDLCAIEQEWRAFERDADCTVFQTFDWLSTWQRHVGAVSGVTPAIVAGRDGAGKLLFLMPFGVRSAGLARELAWLGTDLCDYNAPLLAPDFAERVDRARFLALWADIVRYLQDHPRLCFDYVNLEKMPERVGAQPNPMLHLGVTLNPSGAYLVHLTGDWDSFYAARRSSHARKGDRNKRRRLVEAGDVRLADAKNAAEAVATLEILMAQKAKAFARMGVADLFNKPGYADFFRALVSEPATQDLIYVSSLKVGAVDAACNMGVIHRGCFYHLLASYDDGDLSRHGPGAIHLCDLLQMAVQRGYRVFDFTIGDERYKRDWCDTELKLFDYLAAVTARGAPVAVPMLVMRRLKRWIKQTPMIRDAYYRVRAFAGALLGRR